MIQHADDGDLEREFPPGDGTAETSAMVVCPHCGEPAEIGIDPGGGATQQYVEDCPVCCQPWRVSLRYDAHGTPFISLTPLEE